jgi:hypothetical protein
MIRDLGVVRPGTTLYLPFHTFDSNDPSASVTLTGLATTDIEIYKDGSTTQRASDAGYALLDTDGIDFDATTGIHGISIDLADNTTAGFYAAGSQYWVVVASVTVDAATVNFVLATFTIGYEGALLNTTIAAYTSTDNFTLNAGSADNNAYNGCILVAHDVASAVQTQIGVIESYTGASKTVNLKADPGVFTMTANDNISIMPPALLPTTMGTTLDVTTTGGAGIDWGNVENPTTAVDLSGTDIQLCDTVTTLTGHTAQTGDTYALANGAQGFAAIDTVVDGIQTDLDNPTDGLGALKTVMDTTGVALTSTAVAAIWDETMTAHVTADSAAVHLKDTLADTNELQGDWADSGRLDLILDSRMAEASINTTGGSVDSVTAVAQVDDKVGYALSSAGVDAIWDETMTAHVTADSAAVALKDTLADTNELQSDDVPGLIATAQADLDTITGSDGVTLATAQGLYAPSKAGDAMTLTAAAVDLVWDEQLTTSTHNGVDSAGRFLRQVDRAWIISEGTADAGGANTLDLETGVASTTDDIYNGDRIVITDGTGAGEHGIIIDYDGVTNQRATMAANWVVTPDATSEYIIIPADADIESWQHGVVTLSATTALPEVDAKSISDNATSADNLEQSTLGVITGAAAAGTLSTTQMTTDLTGYANDELIGREIVWQSGDADGQASTITDYASASGLLTFDTIITLPTAGDTFVIV